MSSDAVKVIVKTMQDSDFLELLFRDPERALSGYRLTAEEKSGLKELNRPAYDRAMNEMEQDLRRRIMQGGINMEDSRLKYTDYPIIVVEK